MNSYSKEMTPEEEVAFLAKLKRAKEGEAMPQPEAYEFKPKVRKMAMVGKLKTEQEEKPSSLENTILIERMKAYAKRYLNRHPGTKPERLKRIVSKKFNITLT